MNVKCKPKEGKEKPKPAAQKKDEKRKLPKPAAQKTFTNVYISKPTAQKDDTNVNTREQKKDTNINSQSQPAKPTRIVCLHLYHFFSHSLAFTFVSSFFICTFEIYTFVNIFINALW